MGNQSASGIVAEERATNEAPEKAQEVSSPDDLKEENQTLIQEKAAGADSHDAEADKSPPVERLSSEVSEENKGSVNEDCETQTAALPDVSSNHVEPKESNLEEGISKFNNEVHDQPCTLEGEMQRSDLNLKPNSTSTTTNLNSLPHVAVNITSEPQEDQNMLVKEIVETPRLVNSCQIEEGSCLVDTKVVQNLGVSATSDIDDHDVEKNEDELVVADMASVKSALSEMCTRREELGMVSTTDNTENGVRNERRDGDPPQEGQNNSFNTLNDLPSISLQDFSAANLVEERLMMNELGNGDNTSHVDQTQPPDQAINLFLSCSNAQPEMIKSDIKNNGEEHAVEVDSVSGLEKVDLVSEVKAEDERDQIGWDTSLKAEDERDQIGWDTSLKSIPSEELKDPKENEMVKEIGLVQKEGLIAMAENQEDDKSTGESSAKENDHESEISTMEKCVSESKSSLEIKRVTEFETAQNAQVLSSIIAEAEIPPSLSSEQYSNSETPILEDSEYKGHESTEMLDIESIPSYIGGQVELRKSPSFEFGLFFDARSEESDQTPLLYQDRTATRSFSSCSTLRFQNRSVQTEYLGKSLQYEAVEVEEKTIRMERSNSESSRVPSLNLLNKEEKANVVTKAKQENSASDKKQENGLKPSPSREDCAILSPKGNGKRKPRSSLFTTCMCCTAAIS
ncbi:hypothetical protein Pfo_016097 [Paulownia fortunei]|nr:hypothetical protein Pfo_016097 [Paulownia fortunei]